MPLRDYEMIKLLGEGGFGNVYQVKKISDGLQFAMKKIAPTVKFGSFWLLDMEELSSINIP